MLHSNRRSVYCCNTFFKWLNWLSWLINFGFLPVNIEFTRFAIEQLLSFHLYHYFSVYMDTKSWFYKWTGMLYLWQALFFTFQSSKILKVAGEQMKGIPYVELSWTLTTSQCWWLLWTTCFRVSHVFFTENKL